MAAWALTAFAPGFTRQIRSSCRLHVCIRFSPLKRESGHSFPVGNPLHDLLDGRRNVHGRRKSEAVIFVDVHRSGCCIDFRENLLEPGFQLLVVAHVRNSFRAIV